MGNQKTSTGFSGLTLIKPRKLILFFSLFVVFYGLLMAPWPGLLSAYSKCYHTGASFFFNSFGSKGIVRFFVTEDKKNIELYFATIDQIARKEMKSDDIPGISYSYHTLDYTSVVFMLALIFATPVPPKRKIISIISGLILVHLFIAFKLAMMILHSFIDEPFLMFDFSPFWELMIYIAYRNNFNVTFSFMISAIIWILVTFRFKDIIRFISLNKIETAK